MPLAPARLPLCWAATIRSLAAATWPFRQIPQPGGCQLALPPSLGFGHWILDFNDKRQNDTLLALLVFEERPARPLEDQEQRHLPSARSCALLSALLAAYTAAVLIAVCYDQLNWFVDDTW